MNHSTGSISLSSLRSLQSTSSSEAPHRFQSTPAIPQTMLGGNMRLSASDAALISLSAASRASPPRVQQRPRTRDPILGCVPEDPTLPRAMTSSASSETVFRYGSRTVSFPARGSIASIGDPFEATKHVSRKKQQLEYELWCEQQKRSNAEAQLRTVVVHGRSKPPWIGEVEERPGLMPIFTR